MDDLEDHKEKHLRVFEAVSTFDEALVKVVQIIEREKFEMPTVEINPCYGEETPHYFVVVTGLIEKGNYDRFGSE